jgi:transcription elongation GreA/GreB family factor
MAYIDKKGYEEQKKSLRELKKKIEEVRLEKGTSAAESQSDSWHDNFGFENAKNQEMMLLKEYYKRREELSRVVLLEDKPKQGTISIGSTFSLGVDDGRANIASTYKMVSGVGALNGNEVSVNSPLGRAVFGKGEGERVAYEIQGKKFTGMVKKVS